jgi:SAM-dependent MidA family methyltransferase
VVVANEFFDALPVHVFRVRFPFITTSPLLLPMLTLEQRIQGKWREILVDHDHDSSRWTETVADYDRALMLVPFSPHKLRLVVSQRPTLAAMACEQACMRAGITPSSDTWWEVCMDAHTVMRTISQRIAHGGGLALIMDYGDWGQHAPSLRVRIRMCVPEIDDDRSCSSGHAQLCCPRTS